MDGGYLSARKSLERAIIIAEASSSLVPSLRDKLYAFLFLTSEVAIAFWNWNTTLRKKQYG